MHILQFLRIFWARRWLVVIAMVASVIGAWVVLLIVPPRYEATSRVTLNTIVRPDPITGEVTNARTAGAYFDAQIELLKDYGVTGRVVDQSGWLSDPGRIAAYQHRPPSDTRDFRRWLSEQVVGDEKATINGTVLEITYKASTPAMARIGAEVLRQAYLDESLASRRQEAAKNAAFYNQQADAARQLAETAETTKAAYEKSSGIIMQGRESDLDSERLASLAGQSSSGPSVNIAPPTSSGAALQLAQIDAMIAEASKRLGPNHPEMQELKLRRSLIANVAAKEAKQAEAVSSGASGAAALSRALAEQKSRVIGERDKIERLRQLQADVDLRRDQYRSAAARAAQYSVEASVTDVGLTPVGVVVTPNKPAFPNKPLILGGSLGMGFALGLALALLLELLNRRVRSAEDLRLSSDIHCIGIVEEPVAPGSGRGIRRALRGLIPRWVGTPA
jgi:protein tyrosine kinase modulator